MALWPAVVFLPLVLAVLAIGRGHEYFAATAFVVIALVVRGLIGRLTKNRTRQKH